MSLAIDRKAINDTLFFGLAVLRQTTVIPGTSFYDPKWDIFTPSTTWRRQQAAGPDGPVQRDADGSACARDGKTLSIVLDVNDTMDYLSISELVSEYWNKVGEDHPQGCRLQPGGRPAMTPRITTWRYGTWGWPWREASMPTRTVSPPGTVRTRRARSGASGSAPTARAA